MRQPEDFSLPLSVEDTSLLLGALVSYVEGWRRHYEEDGGQTHTPEHWDRVRTETGHLIWRLEELAGSPGQPVGHSLHAVRPVEEDGDDDGGAGVREPRRPLPSGPSAATSYDDA